MVRSLSAILGSTREGQHHARGVVKAAHVAGIQRDLSVGLEPGDRYVAELFVHRVHGILEAVSQDQVAADAVEDDRARGLSRAELRARAPSGLTCAVDLILRRALRDAN